MQEYKTTAYFCTFKAKHETQKNSNLIHTEFDSKKEIKCKENYYLVTNTRHASF